MSDGANQTTASAGVGHDAAPGLLPLALGSVGVVYGDIGTSPLYAFREAAIAASNNQVVSRGVVLGVLRAPGRGPRDRPACSERRAHGRRGWAGPVRAP